jgi:hypothetical protein
MCGGTFDGAISGLGLGTRVVGDWSWFGLGFRFVARSPAEAGSSPVVRWPSLSTGVARAYAASAETPRATGIPRSHPGGGRFEQPDSGRCARGNARCPEGQSRNSRAQRGFA